jgi:APA family basic amino acid/polyamine antiporter
MATPATVAAQAGGAPTLVRALGRWTLAALVVNAILGSGIFGLPATVSRHLGDAAPWAWIVGALGNGVIMLCFAEVASRFTAAGGAYLYARAALPRLVALQIGWLAFLIRATAAAAGANLFTVNLAEFLPAAERETVRIAILTLLFGILTALNVHSVKDGARWSNFFTAAKLTPLAIFLAAGGLYLATHDAVAPAAEVATRGGTAAAWLQAVLLIAFAYGGYDGALMAMGEAKDPRRDAPYALVLAMVVLAGLYTAVQLVVDGVLADPAASPRPLVAAAEVFLGPWGGALLAAGALISIAGFLGANFLGSPRVLYALAENHDVPRLFGRVHPRFRTPYVAIVVFGLAVWALAVRGSFEWNAALSAIARLFVYGSTCIVLLVLRRRGPTSLSSRLSSDARFVLPGGPLFAGVGLVFCALLATRMGRAELVILGTFAAVAFVHWLIVRRGDAALAVGRQ